MDKWISKKSLKKKQDAPWMSKEIKRMIRKKDRFYKQFRKTLRNKLHTIYQNYLLDPEKDATSTTFRNTSNPGSRIQ